MLARKIKSSKRKCKTCDNEYCTKILRFNIPDETKGKFCAEHKKDEMIGVKYKIHEEICGVQPKLSIMDKTKNGFCSAHGRIITYTE